MIINPPKILLNVRPDAQPVDVTQQEYDETRKRICEQHPDMGAGELDEHLDYVLCTIARPGKVLEPGTITDLTQIANSFMADTTSLRDSLRALHSAQVEEIRTVAVGLQEVKKEFHDDIDAATLLVEKSVTATGKSITDAIENQTMMMRHCSEAASKSVLEIYEDIVVMSKNLRDDLFDVDACRAARHKVESRDRWIQTGIIAASILGVVAALLRGVL